MSDPLSVTAGILAVATAAFKVAKGLNQLADEIGSAGQEVRFYASEIDSFAKLLRRIRTHLLDQPDTSTPYEQSLLVDIIGVCERVLDPIKNIQATLTPLLGHCRTSQRKLRCFSLRVQWIFSKKDKLLFYRGALSRQHRLLDTTLDLMILQSTRDRSPQNIYVLQVSLENSIAGIKTALNDSAQLRVEETARITVSQVHLLTARGEVHKSSPAETDVFRSPAQTGEATKQRNATAAQDPLSQEDETDRGPDATVVYSQVPESGDGSKEAFEELDVEEELNKHFNDYAQDLWEDMRAVSRKVVRYASEVLRTSQEQPEPSSDHATQETPRARDAESRRPDASSESPSPGTPLSPHPRPDPHASAHISGDLQSVHDIMPKASDRENHSSAQHNISFKNARGETYEVPFEEIRNWEDMLKFLRDMTARLPLEEENACLVGEFDLIGPQGQVLMPQFWSRIIQPGWTIEFRFHDDRLNLTTGSRAELEEMKRQLDFKRARLDIAKQKAKIDGEMALLMGGKLKDDPLMQNSEQMGDLEYWEDMVNRKKANVKYEKRTRQLKREFDALQMGRTKRFIKCLTGQ